MDILIVNYNSGIVICWRYKRNLFPFMTCDSKLKVNYLSKATNHQILWSAIFLTGRFVHSRYHTINVMQDTSGYYKVSHQIPSP